MQDYMLHCSLKCVLSVFNFVLLSKANYLTFFLLAVYKQGTLMTLNIRYAVESIQNKALYTAVVRD